MSYFRTGVAIATMLMGLDFAFACPEPESIQDPDQVEILDQYLNNYRIDQANYRYYAADNSDRCSHIENLNENTRVLVVWEEYGEIRADVTQASQDQTVDHPEGPVFLIVHR